MMPNRVYRRNLTVAVAFIALLPSLVGMYFLDQARRKSDREAQQALSAVVSEQLLAAKRDAWARYDSAIDACDRGNAIRRHDSQQDIAIKALARLTAIFLDSSVDLRIEIGKEDAAREAADLRDAINVIAREFRDAPQIACSKVIVEPTFPRP